MKRSLLFLTLLACLAWLPAVAAEVDTVQFGIDKAYLYDGGKVAIPILIANETGIGSMGWGFSLSTTGQPLRPDSISAAGRVTRNFHDANLLVTNYNGIPAQTDTVCFLIITVPPSRCLPEGNGLVGYLWFSGGALGDQLEIAQDLIDSSQGGGGGCFFDSIHVVGCSGVDPKQDIIIPTTLTVVPSSVVVSCPDTVIAQTAIPVTFPVSINGLGNSFFLQIESFTGPSNVGPLPVISGSNPFQVSWTPPLKFGGEYVLNLRAEDTHGSSVIKTVLIRASTSLVQGDTNCDGKVDLVDLTRMISYLTGGASAPVCAGKTQ